MPAPHDLPPTTSPTRRRADRSARPSLTTQGTGHPRIHPTNDGHLYAGRHAQPSLRLHGAVTVIGSADSADVVVPGLAPRHAEIRRSDADEYVVRQLGGTVTLNGASCREAQLHSGDRVACGSWSFSFSRDASTDHPHVTRDDLVEPRGLLGHLEQLVFLLYGTATRVRPNRRRHRTAEIAPDLAPPQEG